ncbi:hypothetical protein CC86DRAFT_66600 [Ophiobolus disseminans]|uniref:Uncharacterized protein n=1 Tax=Ophiobolus disseminans TaxID=1469910 RepID=A0A6A6ZSD5_9PLEO|nr:hypothetical protein CC86DRAFT_66600 [Ophiobolus disseminans]
MRTEGESRYTSSNRALPNRRHCWSAHCVISLDCDCYALLLLPGLFLALLRHQSLPEQSSLVLDEKAQRVDAMAPDAASVVPIWRAAIAHPGYSKKMRCRGLRSYMCEHHF